MSTFYVSDFQFPPVAPRVLRHDVLEVVRTAILQGRLKPGARLLEADIAAQMGISRAPVREAVRQLEQEGLVDIQPHRGTTILGVLDEEIEPLHELRVVLEAHAVRRACERAVQSDLDELEDCLERLAALEPGDYESVLDLDLRFHAAILRASGFRVLRRVWESLDAMVRVRSYQSFERVGPANKRVRDTAVEAHACILETLRARDPDAAERAVRDHFMPAPTAARDDKRDKKEKP
jgi:DNA-binding GntR family transcriptional regulator